MLVGPQGLSAETMKKTSISKRKPKPDDAMRSEYRFDYRKAKPNRFASEMTRETVAVVLDPDVAAVFNSAESVNDFLRSVISVLPVSKRKTG